MSHEATRLAWLTTEPQHGARLVLLALADHHNATDNRCFPSVARLVETTRLERKAVLRAIAELEHQRIVSTERKNGCVSRYTLHFLDQSQNGTGDKMGPVTKEDSTSPKMGRDRSQNGTRNRERTGKEPEKVLIDEPAECSPDASLAGSDTNTPPVRKNAVAVARTLKTNAFNTEFQSFFKEYPKPIRPESADKICNLWRSKVIQTKTADDILADIRFRKTTDDWMKKGGRYVPTADSYLERQLWLETTTLIDRLTHELDRHLGNPDSIYHDPSASQAIVENFKAEKARLRELQRGQS